MPGEDRVIDVSTKDYVPDGKGSWKKTRTAATAIYHQIQTEWNKWVCDPDAGSDLHTLRNEKNDAVAGRKATDIVTRALRRLIDKGRIANIVVDVDQDALGRMVIVFSCWDVQNRTQIDADLPLPYGA